MKAFKAGVFAGMLLMTSALGAQNRGAERVDDPVGLFMTEDDMEQLAANGEGDYDWQDELEELAQRLHEPLNLNAATRRQLEQFPFLTDIQVENILAYVYLHGEMKTLYELQLVEEMDRQTIDRLLPFVCVEAAGGKPEFPSLRRILKHGRHEVLTRLDLPFYTRKGYEKNYLGPSPYHSLRYSFRYGDYLQAGLSGEKDAGEPLFALHNARGYDSYSFYFLLKTKGRLKALALGNYRLSFGQGLALSTDFRLGKSFSLATADYRAGGIRKHSSTDEYNFFRGAAATVGVLPGLELTAFYSYRPMDGVVEAGEITSIHKTGLHRTQGEADKRNAFALQLGGGNLTYERSNWKLGVTGLYYVFSLPYEPRLNNYARYNLHGSSFYNVSTDYRYRLGRLVWTGEAAKGRHGYALLNRLEYSFAGGHRLLLLHRHYTHDYWAWFARSFGEGSTVQNENGWYLAAEASPFARWKFFASLDLFAFPWWRYRISKPSRGVDLLFQSTYTPRRHLSMYLNYRYKRKERDVTGTGGESISPIHHHKLRYRLTYARSGLTLRTTADYNHFRQQDVHSHRFAARQGWQFTQSGSYLFPRLPLSVSVQGTYFHTDDYDSRVYASERGLLNTFYTPSFYGRGFRCSACVRFDWNKAFMLLAKLGQTVYQDRTTIGSGNDLIAANRKADLQMQLRIKF